MATDVRRTDIMFVAPQRSCSGLQWSKTKWCVYLYSNCRKWPRVARMWYNHIWLIQLLETTFTSRYCTVPYFKTCNLTNGNWLCYCVSILCRRILTAEKPHRSCKNTVLQKIQHSSHILLIGVLLKSLTSSMVKIALRKLFAGILCGCVVLLVLVAKWVKGKHHPNLSIF